MIEGRIRATVRLGVVRLVAVLMLGVMVALQVSCNRARVDRPGTLGAVEVRNYRGQRLSSVNDFRENSIRGPQKVDKAAYRLKVGGMVDKDLTLTYDQTIKGRRAFKKAVTLYCVEGWAVTILWQGFLVRDLLDEAGVKRGAKIVIFRAEDGYSSSFPVKYFYDKDILMAYKMNGVTIPPERGFPFMLVAEDKWGYKWVKWITEIELSDDTGYRGYWESRGYSNEGDLDKDFFSPRR